MATNSLTLANELTVKQLLSEETLNTLGITGAQARINSLHIELRQAAEMLFDSLEAAGESYLDDTKGADHISGIVLRTGLTYSYIIWYTPGGHYFFCIVRRKIV
jgi:hypothetical protein